MGQSWFTTVFTTAYALVHSVSLVVRVLPDVVICNGPGTCVPVCVAAFALRFFGLKWCKIVFVESFCRSRSLSLSGRMLYPLSDVFVVHWKGLERKISASHPRAVCMERLI